jgi:4-hydroxyproline epimerase
MCRHSCTQTGIKTHCEGLGDITVDVAYGGNFYAIVDPQQNFSDMAGFSAADLVRMSPGLRDRLNAENSFEHPENPRSRA